MTSPWGEGRGEGERVLRLHLMQEVKCDRHRPFLPSRVPFAADAGQGAPGDSASADSPRQSRRGRELFASQEPTGKELPGGRADLESPCAQGGSVPLDMEGLRARSD